MPYINIDGKNIYYREYGSGEPVVFLNGVMMSTSSWAPFIKTVSKDYRMITVDLLDQGRSDSCENEYTIETQSEILKEVIDNLDLDKIHLVGMSYGGKVALSFTTKYQSIVKSLILSNTDSYTTNIMKEIGKGWAYAASTLDGEIFSTVIFPYMYSSNYYAENADDIEEKKKAISKVLKEKWKDRFIRNLGSALNYNVSHLMKNIEIPTLIISSEFDAITPIKHQQYINKHIDGSTWKIIEGAGHAAMYEKPDQYISIIMEFLKNN